MVSPMGGDDDDLRDLDALIDSRTKARTVRDLRWIG